jgi:hypothetical protein
VAEEKERTAGIEGKKDTKTHRRRAVPVRKLPQDIPMRHNHNLLLLPLPEPPPHPLCPLRAILLRKDPLLGNPRDAFTLLGGVEGGEVEAGELGVGFEGGALSGQGLGTEGGKEEEGNGPRCPCRRGVR